MDTAYSRRWICHIGNCEYSFSCEDLALICCISFPGYGVLGKKTKRRRTKESEFSKKPSSTKETPKGKASSKCYKTGKSALAKEPVEEPIADVVMDDSGDDVAHDDNQQQDTLEPKTRKTLNPYWFKQPLRPPTPDPEWNKR
ncbi:hypothetical protein Tco_0054685 [Tanacetum coccineum]